MATYPRPPLAHDDGDDMIFQITDWFVPEADRDWMSQQDPSEPAPLYEIIIYGVTDKGNSVTVKVKGFEPYFFVKLPAKNWSAPVSAVRKLEELLRSGRSKSLIWDKKQRAWAPKDYATMIVPRRLEGHLSYVKCVKRKDFWGFTNERKFHFAKVKVKSLALFNALKKYFNDQWLLETGYQPYESNIDPFIRFIHERNIAPCGWVRLPGGAYTNMSGDSDSTSFSRTQIAVEVNHEDVHPMNINKIAPLLIASFDIECTSSHGDFPVALKDYRKLAQDLVGAVVVEGCANEEDIKGWLSAVFSSKDLIATRTPKGAEIARVFLKHKPDIAKLTQAINDVSPKLAKALAKASAFAAAWEEVEGAEEGGGEDDGDNKRVGTLTQQRTRVENEVLSLLGMATDYGDIRKDGAFYAFPLKGDAIIQIGTTVHRYGSDEIVFKHIATLDTCDAIEGAIVDSYETEAQMLLGWKDMFAELDPDILIGYNIFGFDMDYMWKRAKELGQDVVVKFGDGLGRLTGRCIRNVKEQKLSSSALGDNFLKYFPLDGVVNVDLLKVMQRDQKLDSYKLDSVAAHFLGDHKNDLKPREIFEKFGGSSADRAEIARYCLQDCALVNRLLHKLKVLENNAAMGNVCSVPLSYLFMRGQGIKIFSLVSKECRAKQMVIPVIHKPRPFGVELEEDTLDAVGYEGAIVLDPQEGMYLDTPITVLDYASLYPTSMIERNLSHDCFVMDETYKEEAEASGTKFITVTYDIYEGMGDKKHKTGVQNCTFAQLQPDADGNERRGTIPEILIKLINQRKNTRKKIEYETVEVRTGERYAGLPKRMDNGDIKLLDVELGATKHIDAADIVSVASTYSSFEQAVLDALQLAYKVTANSLYGQIGARTSQIYWKDIAACTTATGRERIMMAKSFVEKEYGGEVIYGDSVMPYTPVLVRNRITGAIGAQTIESLSEANSWQSYDIFKASDGKSRREKEQADAWEWDAWTDRGWSPIVRLIRHKCNKMIWRVKTPTGLVDVTEDHSLMTANRGLLKPGEAAMGTELLHSFPQLSRKTHAVLPGQDASFDTQLEAQKEYMALKAAGFQVHLDICPVTHNYCLSWFQDVQSENPHAIEVLFPLLTSVAGFVYDIETEEGVFQAGIGELIVKNTDSIFIKFPTIDQATGKAVSGKDALPIAIAAGQRAAREIKRILPKPQSLEYEKTLFPFILFSKKRYVGNLYEDDANKKPKQKSMGIVLKRRDNAQIVKIIYGGIIDLLMKGEPLEASVDFLKEQLQNLVEGRTPMDELIVTKTLRGYYKNPQQIAHKVLADRMGERDAGNKPAANDRVPYVYVVPPPNVEVRLQGDRIEHPDYIKEHGLTPDYRHYITNQIMKPVCQLYALCVEQLPGYAFAPSYWMERADELEEHGSYKGNPKKIKDRITAVKMRVAEELLFEPFVSQLANVTVGTKKLSSRAKMLTRILGPPKAVPMPHGAVGGPIQVQVKVDMEKGKGYVLKVTTKLGEEAWEGACLEKSFARKRPYTKTYLTVLGAEKALEYISREKEDQARAHGIAWTIADKTCIRLWKKTLECVHELDDKIRKAEEEGDIAANEDLQELTRFSRLAWAREVIGYTLN